MSSHNLCSAVDWSMSSASLVCIILNTTIFRHELHDRGPRRCPYVSKMRNRVWMDPRYIISTGHMQAALQIYMPLRTSDLLSLLTDVSLSKRNIHSAAFKYAASVRLIRFSNSPSLSVSISNPPVEPPLVCRKSETFQKKVIVCLHIRNVNGQEF